MPVRNLLLSLLFLIQPVLALPSAVLSNLNQPSQGVFENITVFDWVAVPFTTDAAHTNFQGVEIAATTLFPPGLFFVEIWDIDQFGQPNAVVQVLSGPAAPAGNGLQSYTGAISLSANTSYFVVIGTRNGGSQTALFLQDTNQADANPAPIYQLGTDVTGDGAPDVFNRCLGTVGPTLSVGWQCGGVITQSFFPKLRILAEQAAPSPVYSLTAAPLALDFGLVPDGTTSAPLAATISNDGTAPQPLGTLTVGSRFALATDNCSGTTLAPAASCDVSLTFTPDHGGTTTGTLLIPAPDDPVGTYGMPLVGEGDGGQIPLPRPQPGTGAAPAGVPVMPGWVLLLLLAGVVGVAGLRFRAYFNFQSKRRE